MIFPARNLHLFQGFSHGYVSHNQMVIRDNSRIVFNFWGKTHGFRRDIHQFFQQKAMGNSRRNP